MAKNFSFFKSNEHKLCDKMISLLDNEQYDEFLKQLNNSSIETLFKKSKYRSLLNDKLHNEILSNYLLLDLMIKNDYFNVNYFIDYVIANNQKIIDEICRNKNNSIRILDFIERGYRPSMEFIVKNYLKFQNVELIKKLLDLDYHFNENLIEGAFRYEFYNRKNSQLLIRAMKDGYIPHATNFRELIFENNDVLDVLFTKYDPSVEDLNNNFRYNILAKKKIIKLHPEYIYNITGDKDEILKFFQEVLHQGFVPDLEIVSRKAIFSSLVFNDYAIMARLIKEEPEYVKYVAISDKEMRKSLDRLAISMGYFPTKKEVLSSEYVKQSYEFMKQAILQRPELICYYEPIGLDINSEDESYSEDFNELATLAIQNGYHPSKDDLKKNKLLAQSYSVIRSLINSDPDNIELCGRYIHNKSELCRYAVQLGYNGYLRKSVILTEEEIKEKIEAIRKRTLENIQETKKNNHSGNLNDAIFNKFNKGKNEMLEVIINPNYDNYGIDLYNFFEKYSHIFSNDRIYRYFSKNFEVMKLIIAKTPSLIKKLEIENNFSREEVDELCFIALRNGYIPTHDDKAFQYGIEAMKYMIKKDPNFIYECDFGIGLFKGGQPIPEMDEICALALDNGLEIDVVNNYFCDSYIMMKNIIPKSPEKINKCMVSNKEQFDELCKLALSNGYQPSEYSVKRSSNCEASYDIMRILIEKNPNLLLNVKVTDKEELTKLFDLAISKGLKITDYLNKGLLKQCILLDIEYFEGKVTEEEKELIKKAKNLFQNNDEVGNTLSYHLLETSFFKQLTPSQAEIFSCYPFIQEKVIQVIKSNDRNKLELLNYVLKKYQDNIQWINFLESIIEKINSYEYESLWNDLKNRELSDDDYRKLLFLLTQSNHLDIMYYDELNDIEAVRDRYIDNLIKRGTLTSLKTAYLEKMYGIDFEKALSLVKLYGESLDSDKILSLSLDEQRIFEILNNIRNILTINNVDVLRECVMNAERVKISDDLLLAWENKLREIYTKKFNESLTKINNEDKIYLTGEESNFDVYYAAGRDGKKKTRLMITSIGAYTNMKEPDDYYASWNIPKMTSHGVCCSYVGESNLGTARVKYCCFGFTDYDLGALHLQGPYDLCSKSDNKKVAVTSMYDSMYLFPDDMLDYTRHTHNEMVWERRNINENFEYAKKQPSYVVYFVDNFEDRLTKEEARRQWESVKKAAKNFGKDGQSLPIMVVEREKIAKSQKSLIEENLALYEKTLEISLLNDIVVKYENNYSGNREYHQNICDKYFPKTKKLDDSVVGKILKIINEKRKVSPELALENLQALEKILKKELVKYDNAKHGVGVAVPSFNILGALEKIEKMKELIKKQKDNLVMVLTNYQERDIQYRKIDQIKLPKSLAEAQLSIEEIGQILGRNELLGLIKKFEDEIIEEEVNATLKVHGPRHIKNVLMYSGLIGSQLVEDSNDLKLLLYAAKYHDSSRRYDGNERHADDSAKIAEEKLKDICSKEELAVIKTIIEFHEYPRGIYDEDDYFDRLVSKNRVGEADVNKVRLLAEILKDADALDRTRFINDARLEPKYLKTVTAKRLVRFAANLQETYAFLDLEEYDMNSEIELLLQKYTPQEILRTIRHNVKGDVKDKITKRFIGLWARQVRNEQRSNYGK